MIIMSQNKTITIETLELSIETQYNATKCEYEYGIAFNMHKKVGSVQGFILGNFNTQRRAKKVLNEIIMTYQLSEIFKCAKDKNVQDIVLDIFQKKHLQPFIYEIPGE